MCGGICLALLGIGFLFVGIMGCTPKGLPIVRGVNLKGVPGIIVGIICILVGLGFLGLAAVSFLLELARPVPA